ncbi:MAG: methyl-accepting chemotaxis protein, partial [Spirochaetota bacterium]
TLSLLIDNLNEKGQRISQLFNSFMLITSKSHEASGNLDKTNKMIVANSNEILTVTGIMGDFFDEINLLSLNASIEAARAGDSGRGFAVVASEIGKLADNSAHELKQVTDLIEKNKADADRGSRIIDSIISLINDILKDSNLLQGAVSETIGIIQQQEVLRENMSSKTADVKSKSEIIKNSMGEQKSAITELMKSVSDTNLKVQENNEYYNELHTNAEGLRTLAETMK